jgi:hypothetical protein|tara:strand:- start:2150 stop:2989 length:840 start_codon:yes stop_codon:yes gene_type:complete
MVEQTRSDPTIGKELSPHPFRVTDTMVQDYQEGLTLDYDSAGPLPSMLAGWADSFHEAARFTQDKGHLWMRQEWELRAPLVKDDDYLAHAVIKDIYRRRDRTVVNTAMDLKNSADETVVKSWHHQSFLLDAPVEMVQFRDPNKKEGARKFIVPEGAPLDEIDKVIDLEMCGQFFHGNKNYHTDLQASQELGFHDVVVGGHMSMSCMGRLMEQHFGASWWTGGKLDIKFTNPLWPDDHIRIRGVATGPAEDDASRDAVFAWIEKDDGTIVLIANASAPND